MNNKRKSDEEASGRDRKKLKIKTARTIPVQSLPPTSAPSNPNINAAGPSKSRPTAPLPSSLDVEKFVETRAFEIKAMHTAMKTASASSTQRAWQALPRHLRRRAASHDVRRVPLRLRDKAKAEMDPVGKKSQKKALPKQGKAKRLTRTEKLLSRQRDKTWLESHVWHAKRMKMENLWGYRLAIEPTEKSFRPSYRASKHGAIIHDASYFGMIELKGSLDALNSLLLFCCDPQSPRPAAPRYVTGSRILETYIYSPSSYPSGLISPITILWKPFITQNAGEGESGPSTSASGPEHTSRTLWILVHPSAFDKVFGIVKSCASLALDQLRNNGDSCVHEVEIADLRNQINIFEILGPKSNQVLKGALSPTHHEVSGDFEAFWSALGNLQSSGTVARGMVVGCKVNDPRLKFPPKNAKPEPIDAANQIPTMNVFPSAMLARSEIWDESVRLPLKHPKYKKKDIDERKAKNLVPGTPLAPLRQDDRVPILLIQRSVESRSNASSSRGRCTEGVHGWMLVVPAGWSMPFFSSLTYTGTRVGGQRERQVQSFEAGVPYFLKDLPSVAVCEEETSKVAAEEEARWKRTPIAKKPNFQKLGTRSPWRPDWEVVLGLKTEANLGFLPTQREEDCAVIDDAQELGSCHPWLLRGSLLAPLHAPLPSTSVGILNQINVLRAKRSEMPLRATDADLWFRTALVAVELTMCDKGVLEDMAMIYMMGDDEVRAFRGHRHQTYPTDDSSRLELSKGTIIGYVSSGGPSLTSGGGYSIAAIAATKYQELLSQMQRLYPSNRPKDQVPRLLVKGRNRDGQVSWPAWLQVIES